MTTSIESFRAPAAASIHADVGLGSLIQSAEQQTKMSAKLLIVLFQGENAHSDKPDMISAQLI